MPPWGAQGMRLARKYGLDPGAEWEAVWVVSSLLNHLRQLNQCCPAQDCVQHARLWNRSSDPRPEEVDGVTGDKDLQGTEGLPGVTFPRPGLHDSQSSVSSAAPTPTLNPSSPKLEGLTSRNLSCFPLALLSM